jgi:hypothetical protein
MDASDAHVFPVPASNPAVDSVCCHRQIDGADAYPQDIDTGSTVSRTATPGIANTWRRAANMHSRSISSLLFVITDDFGMPMKARRSLGDFSKSPYGKALSQVILACYLTIIFQNMGFANIIRKYGDNRRANRVLAEDVF